MPSIPAWLQRKRVTIPIGVTVLTMAALVLTQAKEQNLWSPDSTAEKTDRTVVKPSACPAPANPDPLSLAGTDSFSSPAKRMLGTNIIINIIILIINNIISKFDT